MRGMVHWEDVESRRRDAGDIGALWTNLGDAIGSVAVGLRRIRIDPGKRSTPVHVHGAEEEIFFILGGRGQLWQGGAACEVREGDALVHVAESEPHTLRAGAEGLDALAFGMRVPVEICYLPRAGMAWAGPTVLAAPGLLNLFQNDAAAGPLEFPSPGPRPANVVAADGASPREVRKGATRMTIRPLGRTGGAKRTGLNHVTIAPGAEGWPPHCHSAEEEIFIVLGGEGFFRLGEEERPVGRGHLISCPAGNGVAHSWRAGGQGLTYLAYGTREANDIAYYPRSRKISLRGIGVIGRLEQADYWDGETPD